MLNPDPTPTTAPQESAEWLSAGSATKHSGPRHRIESTLLLQGRRELLIAHAGEEYRLRLTRNDKLILTK